MHLTNWIHIVGVAYQFYEVAGPPGFEPGPPLPEAGIIKADVSVSYLSGDRRKIGGFVEDG